MASTNVESMRLSSLRKRWQDMKMMPGDFKNMKAIKDMKVGNAKRVEWWRIRRSKERMSKLAERECWKNHMEGYAKAEAKLLAERECWKNHMEGYAKAEAKLLAKMKIAAEEARSSTDRSSTARSSIARFDCCDTDDFEDADFEREAMIEQSKVLDAIVVDKGHESQEGHESHAASTTP